jgi:hypothetical protein
MSYEWLKLYSRGILHGSIVKQMSLEEQMVWIKLLCFASESRERGVIRHAKGIPYEREELARVLGISEFLLNTTIDKCIKDVNFDDARTRIMIGDDGSIHITNWERYQEKPPKIKAKVSAITAMLENKNSLTSNLQANTRAINQLNSMVKTLDQDIKEDK